MRNAISIAVLAVALGTGGFAVASDLDAPVPKHPPTIRSEIKRGHDAGFSCALKFLPLQADDFDACVSDAKDKNRQSMGTGFEAFDIGLYDIASKFTSDSSALSSPELKDTFQRLHHYYESILVINEKSMHLNDADVAKALKDRAS